MKVLAGIIIFFVLIFGVWHIVLHEGLITGIIEDSLSNGGIKIRLEGFKKGLLYSLKAEKAYLYKKQGPGSGTTPDAAAGKGHLLRFEQVDIRLDILSLLKLRPELSLSGRVNNGTVDGRLSLTDTSNSLIYFNGVGMSGLPLFEKNGIRGDGSLSANIVFSGSSGVVKFSVDNAKLQRTALGVVMLPLDIFSKMHGTITVDSETADIKSFILEGQGVYSRISGKITGREIDISIELMIDSDFNTEEPLFGLLEQFKTAPGYYTIPVKAPVNL